MPRAPKPTALKLLAGNPGKRPLNENEPELPAGIGEPPDWLDENAKSEWWRVVPDLENAGVTSRVEQTALACYCQAVSNLRHARLELDTLKSRYIIGIRGPQKHPACADERENMELIKKFAAEFGLTPSSRTKIKARPKTTGNEFADV